VIEAEKAIYRVKRMCELLEVSRSGFYKWRKARAGGPSPAAQRRVELDAKVAAFHNASDGVYGAPRILADLTNLNPARVWGLFLATSGTSTWPRTLTAR